MRRIADLILLAAGLAAPVCYGQSMLDQVNFESGQLGGGLHLLGISAFGGYSTSAIPQAGYVFNPGAANLGGDGNYGATASMSWQAHGLAGDLSVLYSGTFAGQAHYSNLNSYNQSLSIAAAHRLGPKWTFTFSGSGSDNTLAQYLFQPSTQSVITQVPASFDDLAAAAGAGQYTNTEVASLLTGSPMLPTAARSLLYGDRVLSYSGQASLTYAATERLRFHFAGFAASGETLLSSQDGITPGNYIMPRTLGASAGMGFSYALSPQTQAGIDVNEVRSFNSYQKTYTSTASAFIGRKMGAHWFLNLHGGGTYNVYTQQLVGTPVSKQVIGGGTLGFRTGSYTLVASYDRSGSDGYGLAVGSITTMSGTWNWHQIGSRWSVFASFGQQETRNTGFVSFSGWQGSSGLTMVLDPHTSLTAQYVYMDSAGTYLGTYTSMAVQSVRLSLGWSPQPGLR